MCGGFVCLLILATEALLRWQFGKIDRITGAAEWTVGKFGDLTYHWDRYDPRYGWTNIAGYHSDERIPFRVTINHQGLRGLSDYAASPPEGVTRIAMFGDSCTFGEEVDDDQTIAAYLERHLRDVEVLNFGVHGYGLGQMVMRMEDEAFALHPDRIVITVLLPMDLYRDPMPNYVYNKPVFSATNGELQILNVPVPEASQEPWLYRHSFAAAWFFARAQAHEMPPDVTALVATTKAILRRAKELCDEHDVKLTVVAILTYGTIEELGSDPQTRELLTFLTHSLREANVDVVDLLPFLERRYTDEGKALTKQFGHWSGRGNCLIASQIAAHLAASPGLDLAEDVASICEPAATEKSSAPAP